MRLSVTNAEGFAGNFYTGETIKVRRGVHYFRVQVTVPDNNAGSPSLHFQIAPEDWPDKLVALKNLLNTPGEDGSPPKKDEIIRLANAVLKACNDNGLLAQLIDGTQRDAKPDTDNPHIIAGALLCAMTISRLFIIDAGNIKRDHDQPNEEERKNLHAAKRGISGIIYWINTRQHHHDKDGYVQRWKQQVLDGRNEPNDWKAEPSLDEYSGLVMGLRWTLSMAQEYNFGLQNNWATLQKSYANKILNDIRDYLDDTRCWLVRPGADDLTVRGPDIIANAYPLSLVMRPYGHWQFRIYNPLILSDEINEYLDNSSKNLALYKSYGNDWSDHLADKYQKTIDPLLKFREASNAIDLAEWAGILGGTVSIAFGAVIGPFGLPFIAAGVVALGVGIGAATLDKKIGEVTDADIWLLFGQALSSQIAVDAGGYNSLIFDRYSLAALWEGDSIIEQAFSTRATRPYDGDPQGWCSAAIGSRILFGTDFNPDSLVVHLLRDVRGWSSDSANPTPSEELVNLAPIEGFVSGWAMLCLALDMDPQLSWSDVIPQCSYLYCEPTEILETLIPRFQLFLEKVVINEIRENEEEPYLWAIPIIVEAGPSGRHSKIITSTWGYVYPLWPPSLKMGDVRGMHQYFRWKVNQPRKVTHLLLATIGWEYDFTPMETQKDGFFRTVKLIEETLNAFDFVNYPEITDVVMQIEQVLNKELPNLYPMPEAQPGSRISNDDFVGAKVSRLTIGPFTVEEEVDFQVNLSRQPKPKPKFTDMTVYGKLSFKGKQS